MTGRQTSRTARRRSACVGAAAFALIACGGAAKESRAPESAPPPVAAQQGAPPPPPSPPGSGPAAGSAPAAGGAAGAPSREVAFGQAKGELDRAQRELDVAASDCRAACRALGSMDRAAGHLCGIAQESTERDGCEDAKRSVLRARDKVKATCGSCPGGPTVDRNAPVPSAF